MEWLNYHHLLYFWTVAREGTIARASEELRLAQPTISGQIRVLEDQLGEKLWGNGETVWIGNGRLDDVLYRRDEATPETSIVYGTIDA